MENPRFISGVRRPASGVRRPASGADGLPARRRIVFAGWRGPLPPGWPFEELAVRLEARALFSVSFARTLAVVVGTEAILSVQPTLAWSALVPVRDRVIVCDQAEHSYRTLRPWVAAGFPEPIAPEELRESISRLTAPHSRPDLDLAEWLPRVPCAGSKGDDVARALTALDRPLSIADWAHRLGMSRHQLARVCRRDLGLSARDVARAFVVAACRRMRSAGATQEHCATALGLSDARSLRRAVAAR